MHCQALHKMYVSVSIQNQTELNQSSKSPARKLTHITITQRSRACSAPNTQTPRPPTTTQPRLFCAEHPAATPQQPQQLTAHITRNHHLNTPIPPWGRGQASSQLPQGTFQPQNSTPGTVLRGTPDGSHANHKPQTTISPKTIHRYSRYPDGRLSAHAANCSAQNTLITKRAFAL